MSSKIRLILNKRIDAVYPVTSQSSAIMQQFTQRVITIISRIPYGRVTTYGLIAASAGNHCGARQVARILHSSSDKYNLPWHRVVNARGTISPRKSMSHVTQETLLKQEAVHLDSGKVDLQQFLWIP